MRFRFLVMLAVFLAVGALSARAEGLAFTHVPDTLYPGKAERIELRLPADAALTLEVLAADGSTAVTLRDHVSASQGPFTAIFNGNGADGSPLAPGSYTLRALANESTATHPLQIGLPAPRIVSAQAKGMLTNKEITLTADFSLSASGTLSGLLIAPDGSAQPVLFGPVSADDRQAVLSGIQIAVSGTYTLSLTLTDENGISGNSYQLSLELTAPATPKPRPTIRPSQTAAETVPGDYWSMEVGNYDWAAIWKVMISPMTIVQGSGKQAERQTYKLRAAPDTKAQAIGLITCETQGVHVLETLDSGWSRVEVFNSSYGEAYASSGKGSGYGITDDLLQGYVETDRLGTFTPRTDYGLLIDKKTQELYILTENGLLSTLLVSTGFASASQPWNETPAGEFYLSSKVGDFPSGNLICQYGMRFNNGDILHQVPYIYNEKYDLKDFSTCERYLGEKASHGCVRVQRKANDDGINMKWIWENVPIRTKLLIWDDDNRPDPFMDYPLPGDAILYYNPNGGQYYHADQNCASIKNRFLPLEGTVTYADLDLPEFAKLTPCKHCNPPALRMREIDALNAENGY